jgi:hypothetical protein
MPQPQTPEDKIERPTDDEAELTPKQLAAAIEVELTDGIDGWLRSEEARAWLPAPTAPMPKSAPRPRERADTLVSQDFSKPFRYQLVKRLKRRDA